MTGDRKVSADQGSTSVGGDNLGSIINATDGATVNVTLSPGVAQELPSFLGGLIAFFSQQRLGDYGLGERRDLPPEVITKVKYNNLPQDHVVLVDYRRHSLVLEKAYHGVEQQNSDARYLVR